MSFHPLHSPAVYGILAIGLIAALLAAYAFGRDGARRSLLLLGLRAVVFAVLFVILLNPVRRQRTQLPPEPPTVAVLVDCSQSMALGTEQSRIERVRQLIAEADRTVSSRPRPRLTIYRFGRRLARVPELSDLTATEDASQLGAALRRLPARFPEAMPHAVLLFSDGAVDDRAEVEVAAESFVSQELPIHAVLPPESPLRGDLAVSDLVLPSVVREGDEVTVRGVLNCRGFANERVEVAIRPAANPSANALSTLPITLVEGANPFELVVKVDESPRELAVAVPVLASESTAENNVIPFRLPRRDGTVRVLYMEGTQQQEYRWLEEDATIQCTSLVVNSQYASRPRLQRVDDPYRGFPTTRGELFEYDAVICSDIPQGAFTPEQIAWTVELVDRRGGGFAMVGGHTSFGSGGWDRTQWERLIPFDMTGRRDYLGQTFTVEVPDEAASHPIWRLVDDPQRNRAAMDAMPPFAGTNLISRTKPAATLLGRTATPLSRVGVMPIFACETFGRGRTFAMATDTTLSWGTRFEREWGEGDNRYYRTFWRNVVRWLTENSQASQQRLVVSTDRVIYGLGEPIALSVEAFDEELAPSTDYDISAVLRASDNAREDGSTSESTDDASQADAASIGLEASPINARYSGQIAAVLPAKSRDLSRPLQPATIEVTARDGQQVVAVRSLEIQVSNQSQEWLDPTSRPEVLESVATTTGGRVLTSATDVRQVLESAPAAAGSVLTHDRPAWDRNAVWLLLMLLLAAEWSLRRMSADVSGRARTDIERA